MANLSKEWTKLDPNPVGEQLAEDIDMSIVRISDSMSYIDFAFAVSRVIEDSYGRHDYDGFMLELKNNLDKIRKEID